MQIGRGKKTLKSDVAVQSLSLAACRRAKRQLLGFEQRQFLVPPAVVVTTMMEKEQVISVALTDTKSRSRVYGNTYTNVCVCLLSS